MHEKLDDNANSTKTYLVAEMTLKQYTSIYKIALQCNICGNKVIVNHRVQNNNNCCLIMT